MVLQSEHQSWSSSQWDDHFGWRKTKKKTQKKASNGFTNVIMRRGVTRSQKTCVSLPLYALFSAQTAEESPPEQLKDCPETSRRCAADTAFVTTSADGFSVDTARDIWTFPHANTSSDLAALRFHSLRVRSESCGRFTLMVFHPE